MPRSKSRQRVVQTVSRSLASHLKRGWGLAVGPSNWQSLVTLTREVGTNRLQRERTEDWRQCQRRVGGPGSGVRECIFEQNLSEKRGQRMGTWWRKVPQAEGTAGAKSPGRRAPVDLDKRRMQRGKQQQARLHGAGEQLAFSLEGDEKLQEDFERFICLFKKTALWLPNGEL